SDGESATQTYRAAIRTRGRKRSVRFALGLLITDVLCIHPGLVESVSMKKNPYPECPADDLLQDIAAGITPGETVAQNAPHITNCDFCGPRLKQYIHEFSDDLSAEDTAILSQLKSSKSEWRKKLVR